MEGDYSVKENSKYFKREATSYLVKEEKKYFDRPYKNKFVSLIGYYEKPAAGYFQTHQEQYFQKDTHKFFYGMFNLKFRDEKIDKNLCS